MILHKTDLLLKVRAVEGEVWEATWEMAPVSSLQGVPASARACFQKTKSLESLLKKVNNFLPIWRGLGK